MEIAPQLITVDNRSTVFSKLSLFNLIWAINYQVTFQYGRSRWVQGGYSPPGHVVSLKAQTKPPPSAWNLILLDNSDQAGALGYHDDDSGTKIPFSEVFVKESLADGVTVSSVASHEALEMLVDPDVNKVRTATRKDTNQLYIVELCDAVQGCDYDVGAPEGRPTGAIVSDFCEPAWWDLEQPQIDTSGKPLYSFRGSVDAPWKLAPQGYISVAPVDNPNNWSQIYGSEKTQRPSWASRLPRVHGERNY